MKKYVIFCFDALNTFCDVFRGAFLAVGLFFIGFGSIGAKSAKAIGSTGGCFVRVHEMMGAFFYKFSGRLSFLDYWLASVGYPGLLLFNIGRLGAVLEH